MKVILCIEEKSGMLFNLRRVSSDKVVTEKVNEIVGNNLFITDFSKKLFPDASVITQEQVLELGYDDYVFVENLHLKPFVDMVSELIVFHWNRRYPSDFGLDIVPEEKFSLISTEEFVGNSHDKITMEVWKSEK